jgi:hypothetical protein
MANHSGETSGKSISLAIGYARVPIITMARDEALAAVDRR